MPFFSFIFGYIIMQQLLYTPEAITPHLVGKQVHEILPLITQYNLNLRLIDRKEETTLPAGIILNQTPAPGTSIKQNQPIFIVTTKKPLTIATPHYIGLHVDELTRLSQTTNINVKIYYLPHPYPEKICFAQSPQLNEPLEKNSCTIYVSSGNNKPIIWPDFTGIPLHNVVEFLEQYNIKPDIINNNTQKIYATHDDYIIIDQRPLAGTLLTLDHHKPLSVQLRVE